MNPDYGELMRSKMYDVMLNADKCVVVVCNRPSKAILFDCTLQGSVIECRSTIWDLGIVFCHDLLHYEYKNTTFQQLLN